MKKFIAVVVIICTMLSLSGTAFAKTKKLYSDTTSKTVDAQSYAAIEYVKKHGGWSGLIKKNRFYPNKLMTRREFLVTLHNLYGSKVKATINDVILANQVVTSNFCCQRLATLSKALGYKISWSGAKKTQLRRKDVARYIKIFATFNKKLAPKR